MVKKIRRYSVIVFIFFACSAISVAQNENEKQPLSDVLISIQNQYGAQFNYAENTLESILLIPPSNTLSFEEVLRYLEKRTGLIFNILNNNVVSIKKREPLTICGFIKSKNDQNPLAAASIQSKSTSTITDENGFFQLHVKQINEDITIRHLGFKTISKTANAFNRNSCEDIYLQTQMQTLSEIVISNYIVSGINKLNDGTFEIDFSNFDILPGLVEADVLQSVQAFPGIQSDNETVSNINIRGGSHDQNLILWDDIKMYQSGHFFGLISMYNPQITQEVSLIKNGTDVSYTDGTSGTISMKTDADINTRFNGSMGVNFIDANGFVDTPLGKKSSIQIAARKSISEFVKTPTYNEFFERISQDTEVENNTNNSANSDKSFDFYDTSLRWIYKFSGKDEIRLNFINVSNELVFDENAFIDSTEESRQSKLSQNSIAGGLKYNRKWSDKWQTVFSAYETDYKLKAINANILDSQRFLQENKVSETSLKLNAIFTINEQFQLKNGYQFVETEVTNLDDVDSPIFHSLVSEVVRTHGVYSQISYSSLNRKTNFNAGLRFNYIDKFKKQLWEPRLSFNQRFLNYFTIELLGEFKHQNTSQVVNFQNDFLGIEKRRWQLSNDEDIPVIRSKQASIGVNYNNDAWLVSIEGYFKNVEGITTQSQGFQNQYEFVKTKGRYDVKGLDVLLRKKLGNLNTWLSYGFMNNTYTFNALSERKFPSNYDIEHIVTFGLAYVNHHLKIATGFNWHSGKPTTKPISNNEVVDGEIKFDEANSNRLEDYMRVDISALYNWNISQKTTAKFGVSVWNLLNKTNVINSNYNADGNGSLKIEQQSLGLTPNVVLRIYF